MTIYAVDIETNGLLRPEPGRDRVMDRVHCACAAPIGGGKVLRFHDHPDFERDGDMHSFLRLLRDVELVIGHGIIDFDIPALRSVYGELVPDLPMEKLRDTLVIARVQIPWVKELDLRRHGFPKKLVSSHSLEAWGYRLGNRKGSFSALADKDPTLWDHLSQDMLDYCAQDTEVTAELYSKLTSKWGDDVPQAQALEHRFAREIGVMMNSGVDFDMDGALLLAAKLSDKLVEVDEKLSLSLGNRTTNWKTKVRQEPRSKTVPVNPGSRMQVAEVLVRDYGWDPRKYRVDGIPTLDEATIKDLPKSVPQELRDLLVEHFLLQKRVGQISTGNRAWVKYAVDHGDGVYRIHGYVNHNGAHTSRCTHRHPNMGQVPRVGSPYGDECRALFRAPPGFDFVGADISGVDAVGLAHYLVPYDKGAFRDRLIAGDVHVENSGLTGLDRQSAKNTLYAVAYGALPKKVALMNGLPIKEGKRIRNAILAAVPGLDKLINDVQEASKRGYLIGLDGRRLRPRKTFAALNTLVQGAASIVMKQATVRAADYAGDLGARMVLHVHDEYQWECREGDGIALGGILVQAIELAGEDLGLECPVSGEYKVGKTWADTH